MRDNGTLIPVSLATVPEPGPRRFVIEDLIPEGDTSVLYGDDALQGDANTVHTALRISERCSRLLGLDVPHSIEARTRIDVLSWNQGHTGLHRYPERGLRRWPEGREDAGTG